MTELALTPLRSRRSGWWLGAAVFVGAAVLAAVMSPTVSIWTDEAVTISAAERSLPELFALTQRIDAVHAVYYAFMSLWIDLFGASPFSLRLPSALAGGGTALGVFVLARAVASIPTAIFAAAITATLPRLTWGGIEARPFVFSALVAVWASVLLVRAMRHPTRGAWVAYGAVAALGVAVNVYLVMLVAAHAATIVSRARKDRAVVTGFAVTGAVVAVVSVPLILLVRSQQAQLGGNGERNPLQIARRILVNQFFLGETPDAESAAPWFTRAWQLSALIACVLGVSAILCALLRRPAVGDRKADILAVTVPWIVLPTALVAIYSVLVSPIYQPRYFTFTAPAAALLIAAGARTVRRRWVVTAAATIYLCAVAVVFVSQRIPFAKSGSDWAAVAETVRDQREDGDGVFFAPRYATGDDAAPITLTTRRIAQSYPGAFDALTDLTLERTGADTATLDGYSRPLADAESDVLTHDRVWALYNRSAPASVYDDSDGLFRDLGYASQVMWSGPATTVVLYSRP